jgi:hypothetical protein
MKKTMEKHPVGVKKNGMRFITVNGRVIPVGYRKFNSVPHAAAQSLVALHGVTKGDKGQPMTYYGQKMSLGKALHLSLQNTPSNAKASNALKVLGPTIAGAHGKHIRRAFKYL